MVVHAMITKVKAARSLKVVVHVMIAKAKAARSLKVVVHAMIAKAKAVRSLKAVVHAMKKVRAHLPRVVVSLTGVKQVMQSALIRVKKRHKQHFLLSFLELTACPMLAGCFLLF